METSICEQAIQILHKTNDGNDLDPKHLSIIQSAVNGWLTEKGIKAFEELYASAVETDTYTKPDFHGVVNLTVDNEGYVYWKGTQIEHYSHPFTNDSREHATELGRCCRYLEHLGLAVNMTTAIWKWDDIKQQHPGYDTFETDTVTR